MDCFTENLILPLVYGLFQLKWVQAIGYLVFLLYLFLGIAIIADIFMCAIERITSSTRRVQVKTGTGDNDSVETVEVRIWNDTVANLTLMALGSSAPEILLSIIEIVGNGFHAGELGPGTIVGSAAFNLLIITGICIVSIPKNESRSIKAIKVFGVTAFFSVFAYFWLFFILVISSPHRIDIWEAFLTFIFFPLLVGLAFVADKDFFKKKVDLDKQHMELDTVTVPGYLLKGKMTKKSLAKFIREVRKVDPNISNEDAACLAATYMFENEQHSRLFYRVSACRQMTGSKAPLPHLNDHLQNIYDLWKFSAKKVVKSKDAVDGVQTTLEMKTVAAESAHKQNIAVVQFSAPTAIVLENAGKVEVTVERFGRLDSGFTCIVETLDRTAKRDLDYKPVKETVTFEPNETEKKVDIEIIDDKNWNLDKVFLVKLSLPEPVGDSEEREDVAKGRLCMMTVTIVDDDEPGIIAFGQRMITIGENVGKVVVPILREQGADGEIRVKYKTIDGTARHGRDFHGGEKEVVFGHGVIRKVIEIPIVDDFDEEKDEYFEVMLVSADNGAKIGKMNTVMVTVTNDDDYNTAMTRLMTKIKLNRDGFKLHRVAWKEQFKTAMVINGSENDQDEVDGKEVEGDDGGTCCGPTSLDYFLHVLSFGWKIVFALVPPVGIWGGWLTFIVSLAVIGMITAVVGDVASTFGCLIGLEKSLNAITFVALGTSLPDLFASRTAARMEKHADNAVGNVTGSNSVNVFLGLGLPWLVASIYWWAKGEVFEVPTKSLGFSVGLYTAVSLIAIGVLLARRVLPIFGPGELGGPPKYSMACTILFIALWFVYIGLSALQAYGIIAT